MISVGSNVRTGAVSGTGNDAVTGHGRNFDKGGGNGSTGAVSGTGGDTGVGSHR